MRLGLLVRSKKTFLAAKKFLGGMPHGNINDNLKALRAHMKHAKAINHDPNTVYPEFQGSSDGDSQDNYYETPSLSSSDDYHSNESDDESIALGDVTGSAIEKAESGDVVGALPLFQNAVNVSPQSSQAYENLGVTQMRLGLLEAAEHSFLKAKNILNAKGLRQEDSLIANMLALKQHKEHAEEIGHNMREMYPEFRAEDHSSNGDEYIDEYEEIGQDVYGKSNSKMGKISVTFDLKLPLGLGIDTDIRVDYVKEGSQAASLGMRPGDEIFAIDDTKVESLQEFKVAIGKLRDSGKPEVVLHVMGIPVHRTSGLEHTESTTAPHTSKEGYCDDGDSIEVLKSMQSDHYHPYK